MAEVHVYPAERLQNEEWRELQVIQREGFMSVVQRSREEVDYLVDWDDPDRYRTAHADANTEVGRRFRPNQEFNEPRVAVATEDNQLIGYMYTANNVSGDSKVTRAAKRLSVVKNYLWIREVAVHPDFQRQGVARDLGRSLLETAIGRQPVTAYIWPKEISFLQNTLEKLGFVNTGSREVTLFGNSDMTQQMRMQAPSVEHVLSRLNHSTE